MTTQTAPKSKLKLLTGLLIGVLCLSQFTTGYLLYKTEQRVTELEKVQDVTILAMIKNLELTKWLIDQVNIIVQILQPAQNQDNISTPPPAPTPSGEYEI